MKTKRLYVQRWQKPHWWADETGSIPLALLVTFIGVGLSTVLAGQVLSQLSTTRSTTRQNQAIAAAQAGIDVALTRIRLAVDGTDPDGNPQGSLAELPCGPLTGLTDNAGTGRYQVRITYLRDDPRGHDDAWADAAGNALTCGSGGPTVVPVYALIRAEGTDVPTGAIATVAHRSLRATYTFKFTNENIPGGLIHVGKGANGNNLCLDASPSGTPPVGAEHPGAGTPVKTQTCVANRPSQIFAYDDSLHLVLVSTITRTDPGMCLDGDSPHTSSSTTTITFQPCVPPTTPTNRIRQMWSLNDSSNFQGTTDGTNLNGRCFNVTLSPPGNNVVLGGCGGNAYQIWSLDPTVGAGMAGADTGRLVNFKQFGRCIDVTNFVETATFLIIWPCKQLPNGTVRWNQAWEWPLIPPTAVSVQGSVSTYSTDTAANGGQIWLCLRTPGTPSSGYVTLAAVPGSCNRTNPTGATRWTIYGDTRFDADPSNNDKSYTIVDYLGYCLTPRSPTATPSDFFIDDISKLQVAVCDGTTLQKWNAPPSFNQRSPLKDIGEDTGS